jgi:hypothetical protein
MFTDRKARQVNDIITVVIANSLPRRVTLPRPGQETTVDGKVENWFTVDISAARLAAY